MFIEQAYKGKNDWWRILITTLLSSGIFIVSIILFFVLPDEVIEQSADIAKSMSSTASLILNLVPFAFLLGLLFLLVYNLHERSLLSLTTSRTKVDFKRIFFSFGLIVLLTLVSFGISYATDSSEIKWNFQPTKFTVLLILSLILFPFQIGLEEYLFRGYFMQQIGIAARNRWTPLIITSVCFGLLHSANPEVGELGYGVMVFYIGTGFLLGIMTLMDEGMELALGFHLGNNLMAALLVTTDYSALQTDSLFKYTGKENSEDTFKEMITAMLIAYPIILFIFAKRYKWNNWKEKLTGIVKKPATNIKIENND